MWDGMCTEQPPTNALLLFVCEQISLEVVRQLQNQEELYRNQHKTRVKVVGFGASASDLIFEPKGIPLDELLQRLEGCASGKTFGGQQPPAAATTIGGSLLERLDALQDLPIPILVDCSAQTNTQELYSACIERGIHVSATVCGSL